MTEPRTQFADTITALISPYQHAESYTLTLRSAIPDGRPTAEIRVHRTTHASLLDQLASAVQPSYALAAGGLHGGYQSKPTARLAAIDRLLAIDAGAGMWMLKLGLRLREDTAANCRALVGADMTILELRELVRDAARWLTWAQLVTGWETPPQGIRAPCPACGMRDSIKTRPELPKAWCTSCNVTWSDEAEIAMLAMHVRWCNGELETERIGA
jgi:hypothetical protein